MPARRSFSRSRIYIISLILVGAIAFEGCSRDNELAFKPPDYTPPAINVTLTPEGEPIYPGSLIGITVSATSGDAHINKTRCKLSGALEIDDTIIYSPPAKEITETYSFEIPFGQEFDSSLALSITVYNVLHDSGIYVQIIPIFDNVPPSMILTHDSTLSYLPGAEVPIQVTASDNVTLNFITFSTVGAFYWTDTIKFEEPYPSEVDTQINIPIKDTIYSGLEFWVVAEAVDHNFNSYLDTLDHEISIIDETGPIIEIHPADGDYWVQVGDLLRFWVVGRDNIPLGCLGYKLRYGNTHLWWDIIIRDSVCRDFEAVDSAYFTFYIPDSAYCHNFLELRDFGYDTLGNFAAHDSYASQTVFMVEDRIRFSQAKKFEALYPNTFGALLVDDRRDLVYTFNVATTALRIYSQSTQEFLSPVPLPTQIYYPCFASDTNSILIISRQEQCLSIIDIDAPTPRVDTTISLPGMIFDIAPLSDGTALIPVFPENEPSFLLRLDLTTFEMDTLDLGMNPDIVRTSGNSEYALLLESMYPARGTHMALYQPGVGLLASQIVDLTITCPGVNYDATQIYCTGYISPEEIAIVLDNNLMLIDSIPSIPCNYYRHRGIFSRDGRDIFTIDANTIGIINTQSFDFDGYYWTNQDYGAQPYFGAIAVNGDNDRLFLVSDNLTGTGYIFWDIPLEPRRD